MPTSDIQEDEGKRDNNLSNFVAVQTPSGFVHYPLTHYPTQWHKLQLACVCRRPWYIFTHTHDMMRVEFDYIYGTRGFGHIANVHFENIVFCLGIEVLVSGFGFCCLG